MDASFKSRRTFPALAICAAAFGLSGCLATASLNADEAAERAAIEKTVLPTEASMREDSRASAKGRPDEPTGLSVIEKRHLYARRVMASCVEMAPDFEAGLRSSALQPAPRLSSGAQSFADRTFKVAASTNGRYCDVRALGGSLERFAEGMRLAFESGGEVLEWSARDESNWRGAVMIGGRRYTATAKVTRLPSGRMMVAVLRRG